MAKAPKPRSAPENDVRRVAIQITCRDEKKILRMEDLGPADDRLSRRQTGFPVTTVMEEETFGADSLLILWWMARRKSGESDLRYMQVEEEFPTYRAMQEADFKIEAIEEDENDPKESVSEDPLSSDDG